MQLMQLKILKFTIFAIKKLQKTKNKLTEIKSIIFFIVNNLNLIYLLNKKNNFSLNKVIIILI